MHFIRRQRINQMHSGRPSQIFLHCLPHHRTQMNGIHQLNILMEMCIRDRVTRFIFPLSNGAPSSAYRRFIGSDNPPDVVRAG